MENNIEVQQEHIDELFLDTLTDDIRKWIDTSTNHSYVYIEYTEDHVRRSTIIIKMSRYETKCHICDIHNRMSKHDSYKNRHLICIHFKNYKAESILELVVSLKDSKIWRVYFELVRKKVNTDFVPFIELPNNDDKIILHASNETKEISLDKKYTVKQIYEESRCLCKKHIPDDEKKITASFCYAFLPRLESLALALSDRTDEPQFEEYVIEI